MNARSLKKLIALNAGLLIALGAAVTMSPEPAEAQLGGGGRYMMVAGEVKGRTNQDGVYIIELNSQRLAAIMFDSAADRLDLIDGRSISRDVRGQGGR